MRELLKIDDFENKLGLYILKYAVMFEISFAKFQNLKCVTFLKIVFNANHAHAHAHAHKY